MALPDTSQGCAGGPGVQGRIIDLGGVDTSRSVPGSYQHFSIGQAGSGMLTAGSRERWSSRPRVSGRIVNFHAGQSSSAHAGAAGHEDFTGNQQSGCMQLSGFCKRSRSRPGARGGIKDFRRLQRRSSQPTESENTAIRQQGSGMKLARRA